MISKFFNKEHVLSDRSEERSLPDVERKEVPADSSWESPVCSFLLERDAADSLGASVQTCRGLGQVARETERCGETHPGAGDAQHPLSLNQLDSLQRNRADGSRSCSSSK